MVSLLARREPGWYNKLCPTGGTGVDNYTRYVQESVMRTGVFACFVLLAAGSLTSALAGPAQPTTDRLSRFDFVYQFGEYCG